ncbi:hypothetical protein ANANG_G00127750 [Anguilla anguilla]|uniref:Uncharacterized protein n=1 Tax=Anguilla anguilla TaxID=7936 RepID=A0A9D3MHY4_ANGAN|nr:hypothetical protein ANANG_G00127750 [Anguilla anguilla]
MLPEHTPAPTPPCKRHRPVSKGGWLCWNTSGQDGCRVELRTGGLWEMAAMTEDTLGNPQSSFKAVALRVVDLPLSVYNSFSQVRFSTSTKKLFAVTAFSAISLLFLARHFKRRKGKKKAQSPWEPENYEFLTTGPAEKDLYHTSIRQNLSLSLNSKTCPSCNLIPNGSLYSKLSGSLQSLASVKSVNSSSSCTCANTSSCWDKAGEDSDMCNVVNIPVTTPENLYLMGMELFEEALRRWEQALTFRSRQAEDEASCGSVKLGRETPSPRRVWRTSSALSSSTSWNPASLANDIDKNTDVTVREDADDLCLRDTISIASTDSFVSAPRARCRAAEDGDAREGGRHGHQTHRSSVPMTTCCFTESRPTPPMRD